MELCIECNVLPKPPHGKTGKCRPCTKRGASNPNWKGDQIRSNSALHTWIRRNYPKPDLCQMCKQKPPYDLANKSNTYNAETYNRDIKNWEWLCRQCHMLKDGRMKEFIRGGAKFKLKTHCIHGHEFTEENTYVGKTYTRRCKECVLSRMRRYNNPSYVKMRNL